MTPAKQSMTGPRPATGDGAQRRSRALLLILGLVALLSIGGMVGLIGLSVFAGFTMGGLGDDHIVATVNGEHIPQHRFQRRWDAELQTAGVPDSPFLEHALVREIINALIDEEIMVQEAEARVIEIDDEEVARALLAMEVFHDASGRFSKLAYEGFLDRTGTTAALYEDELRRELAIAELRVAIAETEGVGPDQRDAWLAGLREQAEIQEHITGTR